MDVVRDIHNREVPVFIIFGEDEDRDKAIAALVSQGLKEDHRFSVNRQLIVKFKAA